MRKPPIQRSGHDHGDRQIVKKSIIAPRWAANRRVVLKAVAGIAALSASGIGLVPAPIRMGTAQEADETRAQRYVPAENGYGAADAAQGEWVTFQAEFPFWALGASWNGDVGLWPIIAVQLSEDGTAWSETIDVAAYTDDGGQPSRDDRLFTPLIFTNGVQWVRYQTIDRDRVPGEVAGLSFVYIDPTDGPSEEDIGAVGSNEGFGILSVDTLAPPEVITREQWGANENWRFDEGGEIWPPEYRTVSHIIIHHTATANRPSDVPSAIRSIYYYHAVEQEWGDIGYNYLVDHNGRIYQGRFGGQDVIGGHSYQFAIGSSGITTIGNFSNVDITEAAKSALVSICAFAARDLDPLATQDLQEAPDLPVISSHRDVQATTCPGTRLWNDLPEIRTLIAQTLDSGELDTGLPAGIVPGDRVRVQTDDGSRLNLRSTAGGTVVGSLPNDATAWVIDGPTQLDTANWYQVQAESDGETGWATAQFLIVDPPPHPADGDRGYSFGLNLQFIESANLRTSPSTSAQSIATVPVDTWAHVADGPEEGDGFSWYQVVTRENGDGWVIATTIAPAAVDESPDAQFEVDEIVEATQSINVRVRPGISQSVISSASAGTQFVISQPPREMTGHIWYGVYSPGFGGWVVEDFLRETGAPPAARFNINDTFRVTSTTNLRSAPTTSGSVLTTMSVGATGTVVGGPRAANGYVWWNVRLSSGTTGWCIENWLVETDGGTQPPPSAKFAINDTFRVTQSTNLRASGTTSASVLVTMSDGTTGTVIGGPTSANGYVWWNVRLSSGTTGWCIENWLEETDDTPEPPPPEGAFDTGESIRVTANLNLRSAASTAGSVIVVLLAGTTGSVIGGPTSANGFTWWNIQTNQGTGWAVEDWLEETDGGAEPPPPPDGVFDIGDSVRVTERANFRTAAGTSNRVIRVLQVGTTGTIQSGPTNASGFLWWQLQTSSGSGWVIEEVLTEGAATPPPSGGLPAGTDVEVNSNNLRMRSGPGTSNTVLAVLPTGAQLTVVSGPSTGSGFTWYEVSSATYGTGWVADEFIDPV